jgi:hypothetical protein
MMNLDAAKVLEANVGNLGASDQTFATSLLEQLGRRGKLSDKQWDWVEKLAQKALNPPPPLSTMDAGSFTGVIDLFQQAKKHLNYPKITLALPNGQPIQLSMAGHQSKHPGSINITDGKPFGQNTWYGRVDVHGTWTLSPKCTDEILIDQLYDLLVALQENPAGIAAKYGKLTGNCCFCMLQLSDARSIAVGYGPDLRQEVGAAVGLNGTAPVMVESEGLIAKIGPKLGGTS